MSEKANDLLNKFGSAQFDFMIWNTPDNLVARDKARQEISDYIAELEGEIAIMKKYFHKPAHGTCCTCQKCGHTYDECRCDFDEALDDLDKANARIAELEGEINQLIDVSEKMFTAVIAAADSYDEGMRVWDKIVNDWKEG